jgi:hypothetical protein
MKKQQLIRVLVYEGSEDWIQDTLRLRHIKGAFHVGRSSIREVLLGDFLDLAVNSQVEESPNG